MAFTVCQAGKNHNKLGLIAILTARNGYLKEIKSDTQANFESADQTYRGRVESSGTECLEQEELLL